MACQQIKKIMLKGVDYKGLPQESQEILMKYLVGDTWTMIPEEYKSVPDCKEAENSLVQYDATEPPGPQNLIHCLPKMTIHLWMKMGISNLRQ